MDGDLLTSFYPWDTSQLGEEFILCQDHGSMTSDFASSLLLVKLLQQGMAVHIIAADRAKSHYESILRKNSLDLSRLEASGAVTFFQPSMQEKNEGAKPLQIEEKLDTNSGCVFVSAVETAASSSGFLSVPQIRSGIDIFNDLMLHVDKCLSSPKPASFLIDNLDALDVTLSNGKLSRAFLLSLLRRLPDAGAKQCPCVVAQAYLNHPLDQKNFSTIGGPHGYSDPLPSNEGNAKLSEYARYSADVTVDVLPLSSGFSDNVHGVMCISKDLTCQRLQYKAIESGVWCRIV
jgi:hypothetical protein